VLVMVQMVLDVKDNVGQTEFETLRDVIENDSPGINQVINLMAYDVTNAYESFKAAYAKLDPGNN